MSLARRPPDLASLELFASVLRLGSLSRAAAAHYMSQPSASARIRSLEQHLDVTLLQRSSSGSTPTPAGALVAEWASALLESAERFSAGIEALRDQGGERLRIVASYTVAEHMLPEWLAALRHRHPSARVELEVANSTRVVQHLLDGDADFGFVETPQAPGGLASCVIGHDELVLVVNDEHPWAGRQRPIDASLLAQTPLVLREVGSGTRETLEQALGALALRVSPPLLELGSTTAVKHAVLQGTGASVISRLAVNFEVDGGQMQIVPVGLDLRRELRAVWEPNRSRSDLTSSILTQLAAAHSLTGVSVGAA